MIDLRVGDQVVFYWRDAATYWGWMHTEAFRVLEIIRVCTCPSWLDKHRRGTAARPRRSHIHLHFESWQTQRKRRGPFDSCAYDEHLDSIEVGFNHFVLVGERGPEPQMELFEL